jgi:hypothetical protein
MKNLTASRLVVGLSSLLALAAFACSGSSPEGGLGGSSKESNPPSKQAADKNPTTTDTDKATPAPSTPPADTSACGTKTTAAACGDCCIAKNPTAWEAADKVGFDCICAATACQTACAESVCAAADNQNEPTAACKTCLDDKGPACDDKATAACDANADCKAIDACLVASCDPIAQKEAPPAGAGGATPKVLASLRARSATPAIRRQ